MFGDWEFEPIGEFIPGLAGTHDSWGPQIQGLTGSLDPTDEDTVAIDGGEESPGIEVCSFDNRGMGQSSVPTKKSEYTCVRILPIVCLL